VVVIAVLAALLPQLDAGELEPMLVRQRIVALVLALAIALLVFELVRRRRLREEYSWVWIATSVVVAALAIQQDLLLTVSRWIGSTSSVSTLFFGAILFLLALVLQYSVRLSRLTYRHRTLGQRVSLLEAELQRLRDAQPAAPTAPSTATPAKPAAKAKERDEVA
jgi:hypothetical protein